MMSFRIRKYFLPREPAQKSTTQFVDAWSESGRRMRSPAADEDDS
jgi:hypothetical protein